MAKYFYVYDVADGTSDQIVKMYNTEAVINGKKQTYTAEKRVTKENMTGFLDGIKAGGFVGNKEVAEADIAEREAKRILAIKMTDYHNARDAYSEAATNLKKVNAKYGI